MVFILGTIITYNVWITEVNVSVRKYGHINLECVYDTKHKITQSLFIKDYYFWLTVHLWCSNYKKISRNTDLTLEP